MIVERIVVTAPYPADGIAGPVHISFAGSIGLHPLQHTDVDSMYGPGAKLLTFLSDASIGLTKIKICRCIRWIVLHCFGKRCTVITGH